MGRWGQRGLAAALSLCLLCLSGCDFVVTDPEGLLAKPTLNARQAAVYLAVEDTLGAGDILYRRPQRGEFRSSFLFFDMDGDARDEAIVFYALPSESQSTRGKILRESGDGSWFSVYDFAVNSGQIDFVRFSKLLSTDAYCLLIGWQSPSSSTGRAAENFLSVHSYENGVFMPEIDRQFYQDYAVLDFDGNGLDDVVTVGREGGANYQVALLRSVGRHLDRTATLSLSTDADAVLRLSTGSLGYGYGGVYIDELRSDSLYATEVVQVDRAGMSLLAGGGEPTETDGPSTAWGNYSYTFRQEALLSEDIDGDGEIEIPAVSDALPGGVPGWNTAPVRLTPYLIITRAGLDMKCSAVANTTEGYLLRFPEKWQGRVAVIETGGPDEWRFYAVDTDTEEPAIELLRILAYSASVADAANPDELALGSRGARHFTGYIPHTEVDEPTAITEDELREMFLLPGS